MLTPLAQEFRILPIFWACLDFSGHTGNIFILKQERMDVSSIACAKLKRYQQTLSCQGAVSKDKKVMQFLFGPSIHDGIYQQITMWYCQYFIMILKGARWNFVKQVQVMCKCPANNIFLKFSTKTLVFQILNAIQLRIICHSEHTRSCVLYPQVVQLHV